MVARGSSAWRGCAWPPAFGGRGRRLARWAMGAVGLTGVLAVVSLLVCLQGLPETFAGIAINVVILAAVAHAAFVRDGAPSPGG